MSTSWSERWRPSSAFFFLVVPTTLGIQRGAFDWAPTRHASIDLGTREPGPNIHVLVLDGYPRADVLASAGMDNAEFLTSMQDRGFDVYDDSLSNYDLTPFSLLSMLSLQHVESIESLRLDEPLATVAEQQRVLTRALLDLTCFHLLTVSQRGRGGASGRALSAR